MHDKGPRPLLHESVARPNNCRRGTGPSYAGKPMRDQHVNTLRPKHFQLVTLGQIALRTPTGDDAELGKRRRKLALLAVLALSRKPPSRELLAEMFWGGQEEERARHSLSDTLSHLRRVLGREAIATRSEVVELQMDGKLAVDAIEFEAACESADHERAIALYGGPFLGDFHIDGSETFDDWSTRLRMRYARLFSDACAARCAAARERSDFGVCIAAAIRWIELDRDSTDAALVLLQAALDSGDASLMRRALDEYRLWESRMERDLGTTPDARVATLADRVERAWTVSPPVALGVVPAAPPHVTAAIASEADAPVSDSTFESKPDERIVLRPAKRTSWAPSWRTAAAAAIVGIALLGVTIRRGALAREVPRRPAIALTDVRVDGADSSVSWLAGGIEQMIVADLQHVPLADVAAPAVVHDVLRRARWTDVLDDDRRIDLARRVHATLAVAARVSRSEGDYVIDLTMRGVGPSPLERHVTVTAHDVIAAADEAAARILGAAGITTGGPHLSDLETSNTEALRHFVQGLHLREDGRYDEANAELDAAIAADSGFTSAIAARLHSGDPAVYARLKPLFERARPRLTEFDRVSEATYDAFHGGDHARAEALARDLAGRYPSDPRALAVLADVYFNHGKFAAAESVSRRLLALDSLAVQAGDGPCAACAAYYHLAVVHRARGDYDSEIRALRRMVELQPSAPGAWSALGGALNLVGAADDAIAAFRHAHDLLGTNGYDANIARTLIGARRLDEAEAMTAPHAASGDADARDVLTAIRREQGRHREATAMLDAQVRDGGDGAILVLAHALGRTGQFTRSDLVRARALFDRTFSKPVDTPETKPGVGALRGDAARGFTWAHALMADAVWEYADTAYLKALADSVQRIGAQSYYARDWQLHHHVRGLIAIRGNRLDEAERELNSALEFFPGFTRTNLMLVQVERRRGRPDLAIATLRRAFREPIDAMGRYAPRTELDFEMTLAFAAAGQADSARVYAGYVRRAWAGADSGEKARLSELERAVAP